MLESFGIIEARRSCGVACACVIFAACGSDTKKPPEGPAHCPPAGFEAVRYRAVIDTWAANDRLVFTAATSESEPFDEIVIISRGGTDISIQGAGRYDLSGSNTQDCLVLPGPSAGGSSTEPSRGMCVIAYENCQGGNCENVYLASTGTMIISDYGTPGERFIGRFDNVIFKPITIDRYSGWSSAAAGSNWCAHGFSFDLELEEKKAQSTCVDSGTGILLGDNIANFSLQDCNGNSVDLHSVCGKKAVQLMLVAGWCSACSALIPEAEDYRTANAANGFEVLYLLGEDANFRRPMASFCASYAESHGVPPERMLIDHGDLAWDTTFSYLWPYLGDMMALPWNALLRGTNMEYVYNDEVGPGGFNLVKRSLMDE
ncbi:peroxiredoxin family protein [Myxococcota bacterium]